MSIAGIDRDRFGPVLVDDRLQLRCDFVERLVGGDGFILTVGSTPLRVKDPIGRIMPFRHRPPLRPGISAIYRCLAIADNLDRNSEERRVGKEWVRTGRYRWYPQH